jgi:hypothetical protein
MATDRKKSERPRDAANKEPPAADAPPATILAVDVGGSKVKILVTGQAEPRKMPSGKNLTPAQLVEGVKELAADWDYEAVSIGYPGLVGPHGPRSEPGNLGAGWVGFDFAAAFERPVRFLNDAAMQALGSYEGGRMLFLGLGTGLGSALIAENVVVPLELGHLPHQDGETLGELLGKKGLERLGKDAWRDLVNFIVPALMSAFVADYAVLGGGNAKLVKDARHGIRMGHNLTAFRGGFRLWQLESVPTLPADGQPPAPPKPPAEWRVI